MKEENIMKYKIGDKVWWGHTENTWNASYHRQRIKQAEKDLAYHTSRLVIAKKKPKESL